MKNRASFWIILAGVCLLLTQLNIPVNSQENFKLHIKNEPSFLPQTEIRMNVDSGGYYHLMKSMNLSTWQIDQSISLSNNDKTLRFIIVINESPQAFYRIDRVPLMPVKNMIRIEPGRFIMGSPSDEVGRYLDKEEPQTENILTKGYWIGKYEITQGEFEEIMGNNPSRFKILKDPQLPVESVTWFSAMNFCSELTRREHRAGRLPEGMEYRLPTEAEWAYAARAGTTTRFSYGDDPFYEQLFDYAWFTGNSRLQPHAVGKKESNPWGLHDVHGNVFEWCMDWFDSLPGGVLTNSFGPEDGYDRVVRGGYWDSSPEFCRSALRVHHPPEARLAFIGFRIVMVHNYE